MLDWPILLVILILILIGLWLIFADKKNIWKSGNIRVNVERMKVTPEDIALKPLTISEVPVEFKDTTPVCKYSSKGEMETCTSAEKIFGKPFIKDRPDWLKSPLTGRNLEIDCVNHELKIAIEYNGKQHYVWPNSFNMTEEQFKAQLQRDKFKADRLQQMGYYFIVVPYTVKLEDIEQYIRDRHPDKQRQICSVNRMD